MRTVGRILGSMLAVVLLVLLALPGSASAAADDRVVRVGTEGTYPPFTFEEDGELTGYDIEVIEAVAEEAGWRLEFVQSEFDALFAALDSERIDVIANQISINPEREAKYGLSTPYTYSRGVIVTAAGTDDITTLEDLRGRTTAQSATSNWADVAKDAGAKVQAVDGFAEAAALLEQGRVDAIVNDNIAVLDYLKSTGSDEVKIAGDAEQETSRQALAFRQDDALLEEADSALEALRADGTLTRIAEDYFGADVSRADSGEIVLGKERANRSVPQILLDEAWPMFTKLVAVTIPLTAVSFAIGLAVAVVVALARISSSRLLSWPARAFISLVRGTPLLVQLFIVFYGLPQVGIRLEPFTAAVIAFSINVAGYAAEIVRSAILSVPRGQFEAASTIGMGYLQTMRRVVAPQAGRIAVPPLSNTLLSLVKDTSLASVVLLTEVFRQARLAAAETNEFLALYTFAALYYWVVCTILSVIQNRLETRLNRFVAS